jgi:hypothetical protein
MQTDRVKVMWMLSGISAVILVVTLFGSANSAAVYGLSQDKLVLGGIVMLALVLVYQLIGCLFLQLGARAAGIGDVGYAAAYAVSFSSWVGATAGITVLDIVGLSHLSAWIICFFAISVPMASYGLETSYGKAFLSSFIAVLLGLGVLIVLFFLVFANMMNDFMIRS